MLDYSEHYGTLWGPVTDVGGGQVCVREVRCLPYTKQVSGPSASHPMAVQDGVTTEKGRKENNSSEIE